MTDEHPGEATGASTTGSARSGQLPAFDGERCVHGLLASATCRACVEACPRNAIMLTDSALGLDAEACDGCGLCRPACPEDAISLEGVRLEPLVDRSAGVALWGCRQDGLIDGPGAVPCLYALGDRDLAALDALGVDVVLTSCAGCSSCPQDRFWSFEGALARWSAMRASRREPQPQHERLSLSAWRRAQLSMRRQADDIDQGRRALFRSILAATSAELPARGQQAHLPEGAVHRFVPSLDEGACVGCDACSRVCPHGAIRLEGCAPTQWYALSAERCTGCGLCRDVCEFGAVTIAQMQPQAQKRMLLIDSKCDKCGAPFHLPRSHGAESHEQIATVCRICAVAHKPGCLFQVQR